MLMIAFSHRVVEVEVLLDELKSDDLNHFGELTDHGLHCFNRAFTKVKPIQFDSPLLFLDRGGFPHKSAHRTADCRVVVDKIRVLRLLPLLVLLLVPLIDLCGCQLGRLYLEVEEPVADHFKVGELVLDLKVVVTELEYGVPCNFSQLQLPVAPLVVDTGGLIAIDQLEYN